MDKFAPACPHVAVLGDAADLTRYNGRGQDLTDMVLDGRITGVGGSCKAGEKNTTVLASVAPHFDLLRGPAAPGPTAKFSYSVWVLDGDRVLDRQSYPVTVEFTRNIDKLSLLGDPVNLVLPVTPAKSAAAYTVWFGFELTPDELALNRRRGPR